ncbi:MAG: Uma2 family endonuclease [Planctomycetota bacterium]|nr:Uma2 family endonuclease [Planctomycetota bacterium]
MTDSRDIHPLGHKTVVWIGCDRSGLAAAPNGKIRMPQGIIMLEVETLHELRTLADLVDRLGDVPLDRLILSPAPGVAVEADMIDVRERDNRLCELVDGVLVQKPMGFRESILAAALAQFLREFVVPHNLGHVSGADGMVRLAPGLVRIPDAAYFAWQSFPEGQLPAEAIPDLVPDLAVEVLSGSNTPGEMQRKLKEYFSSGVSLVWVVSPDAPLSRLFSELDRKAVS